MSDPVIIPSLGIENSRLSLAIQNLLSFIWDAVRVSFAEGESDSGLGTLNM